MSISSTPELFQTVKKPPNVTKYGVKDLSAVSVLRCHLQYIGSPAHFYM